MSEPILPSAGQTVLLLHGLNGIALTVCKLTCGIVGVCRGGKLHGGVHQTAGEAEQL